MKYKIGYHLTKDGYLIGEIKVRENPRKQGEYPCSKNVVFVEPPKHKKHTIRKWDGKKWEYVSDFRGNWFNKLDGEPEMIYHIGEEIDLNKYTDKPVDGRFFFQYHNDISNQWEENVLEKKRVETRTIVKDIQKQLDDLDIKKMRYLVEKEKGDLSGKKYFDEYEEETIKLRNELKQLEEGKDESAVLA